MGRPSKATKARRNNIRKLGCILSNIWHLIRYANRAARFISAYGQGLTGPEAAWANRKYHRHRTLPPDIALKLKKEHKLKYGSQI